MSPSNECTFCGNDCGHDHHPCGCGSTYSIDCLMVHGEHQHSVNDHSIVWPVGTDQRLFTAIDAEYESNEEPTDDESSDDEHSQEDLSDNNVYECGNTVVYLSMDISVQILTVTAQNVTKMAQDGVLGSRQTVSRRMYENEPDEEENEGTNYSV